MQYLLVHILKGSGWSMSAYRVCVLSGLGCVFGLIYVVISFGLNHARSANLARLDVVTHTKPF